MQYLGHASNSEGGWLLSRAVLFQPGNTFQTPRIAPQLISRCVETFLWRALSSWHPATELPDKRTQGTLLQTPSPASPNHGFRTHAHFARSGSYAHPLKPPGQTDCWQERVAGTHQLQDKEHQAPFRHPALPLPAMGFEPSHGFRTHADLRAVDLRPTPLTTWAN